MSLTTENPLLQATLDGDKTRTAELIQDQEMRESAVSEYFKLFQHASESDIEKLMWTGVELGILKVQETSEPRPEIQLLINEAKSEGEDFVLPKIKQYLQEHPEAVNEPWPAFAVTPLGEAACSGLRKTVELLLELGADPKAVNSLGEAVTERCRLMGFGDIADIITNYPNPEREREAAESLISALAATIRGDWSDGVKMRYNLIRDLVEKYCNDETEWLEWLENDDNLDECISDGRAIRDWPGPYGDTVSSAELKLLGYEPWCLGTFWEDYVCKD